MIRLRGNAGTSARASAGVLAVVVAMALVVAGCSSDAKKDASKKKQDTPTKSTTTVEPVTDDPGQPGKAATVPDLSGKDLAKAVAALRKAGFKKVQAVDATGKGRKIDVDKTWEVASQASPVSASVDSNNTITIFVTKPSEPAKDPGKLGWVQMPDLLYKPVGSSVKALQKLGISTIVLNDFSGKNRSVPADDTWTVTAEQPVPDTWVQPTARINLGVLPKAETPGSGG